MLGDILVSFLFKDNEACPFQHLYNFIYVLRGIIPARELSCP